MLQRIEQSPIPNHYSSSVVKIQLPESKTGEYYCTANLNLYDSPTCTTLATQAAVGRHLQLLTSSGVDNVVEVCLCEDGYRAWLPVPELPNLQSAAKAYQAVILSRQEITSCLGQVIDFAKTAMAQPNYYLWGGTVGPNYDCSGLMQAAFSASGVWLPRDSYQQEAFTQNIPLDTALPGDLIFFGDNGRVNHVALYLGDGYYIHSSGEKIGRNGIGIDRLSPQESEVSRNYYQIFWGVGRVSVSFGN